MRGPMILVVIFERKLKYAAPCHTVDSSRSNRSVIPHDATSELVFSDSLATSPKCYSVSISMQLHPHLHATSSPSPYSFISIAIELHPTGPSPSPYSFISTAKTTSPPIKLIPGLHPQESFHQHHQYGSFRTIFKRQVLHFYRVAAIYYQSKTGERPLQCLSVGLQ